MIADYVGRIIIGFRLAFFFLFILIGLQRQFDSLGRQIRRDDKGKYRQKEKDMIESVSHNYKKWFSWSD